jgi:hypothetical protein
VSALRLKGLAEFEIISYLVEIQIIDIGVKPYFKRSAHTAQHHMPQIGHIARNGHFVFFRLQAGTV